MAEVTIRKPKANRKFIDLTGKKFGRWIVVGMHHRSPTKSNTYWTCLCECGNSKVVPGNTLKEGASKSCGCLQKQIVSTCNKKHGLYRAPVYYVWHAMLARCEDKNNKNYANYGARGISVYGPWHNFQNFIKDMGLPPDGCSLERIDNNGPYSPENCRWTDRVTQANNKRTNVFLEYNGRKLTIAQWARELGCSYGAVVWRYKTGWPVEDIICTPIDKNRSEALKKHYGSHISRNEARKASKKDRPENTGAIQIP